jgi:hypothetical protein
MPTSGGTTGSTATNMPPGFKSAFNQMGRMAKVNLNRGVGSDVYTGRGVANFDPWQTQGMDQIAGQAGAMNAAGQTGLNTLQGIMQRQPGSNPYIDQMAATARGNVGDSLAAAAGASGRFGSMRYAGAAGQGMAEAENALRYGAYQGDTANSMQAAGMLPAAQQASMAGSQALMGIGGMKQAQDQRDLAWRAQQFQLKENAPWGPIGTAAAMFRGLPFGTTTTTPGPSPWATAMGGGMAGAQMGSSIGGPWGAAIGGLGGFGLGFM